MLLYDICEIWLTKLKFVQMQTSLNGAMPAEVDIELILYVVLLTV